MTFMPQFGFIIMTVVYLVILAAAIALVFKFVRAHEKMADSMQEIARYMKSVDMANRHKDR